MSSPAPKSPEQNEKTRRYDRQLRLWGDHGQQLLENAKVCLVNANALGTEILKSLVLPGIGAFTIIDGEKVTEEDIGSNFFLDAESIGTSRAQAATQSLVELNQEVVGDYIDESLENVMAQNQDFLGSFTVVIASCLPEKLLIPLSKQLWDAGIPLISCRSIGFLGYIRLQVKEHTVIETHPDNENPDLRLENPWPSLREHLDKIDVNALDKKERSHVPAVVILYYYLKKFCSLNGHFPQTRQEKTELKTMILNSFGDDFNQEENFKEAAAFVNTAIGQSKVSSTIQAIFDDEQCSNLTESTPSFWIMAAALRELVQSEGALPVRGVLPDMAADTASYVALQQLYQKRAQEQAEAVHRRVTQILRNLNQPTDAIAEADVRLFCKHAHQLCVARGTCIATECERGSADMAAYLEDPDSPLVYYVILRGVDRFVGEYGAYPGQFDDQVEPDVPKLKATIGKLLAEWGCAPVYRDERVHEVCRYGGAELHSVASALAGCAAHEVVKLITRQYKPLDNTFVYDAITASSATFVL